MIQNRASSQRNPSSRIYTSTHNVLKAAKTATGSHSRRRKKTMRRLVFNCGSSTAPFCGAAHLARMARQDGATGVVGNIAKRRARRQPEFIDDADHESRSVFFGTTGNQPGELSDWRHYGA